MAVIADGIRAESNGAVSFGNYMITEKLKVPDFELNGDIYKVKTHCLITRLEKNGKLLIESVPGAAFHNATVDESAVSFSAEGTGDTQITLELEPSREYMLTVGGTGMGSMKSNLSGKVSFSAELTSEPRDIRIERV